MGEARLFRVILLLCEGFAYVFGPDGLGCYIVVLCGIGWGGFAHSFNFIFNLNLTGLVPDGVGGEGGFYNNMLL